jgi:septal ring factor EnvC (AmiA/AmiB activator)
MRLYTGSWLLFLFFTVLPGLSAQSVESLQGKRETLLEEIANTTKLIQEKKASKEDNLRQLQLMKREISAREGLLNSYQTEIDQLDNQIEVNQMLVNDLEKDIERIKK